MDNPEPVSQRDDDPRLGTFIEQVEVQQKTARLNLPEHVCGVTVVALVGFPYDEGTRRNGGRVGGAFASETVRKLIKKMGSVVNPEENVDLNISVKVYDTGDIPKGMLLEAAHEFLSERVSSLIEQGAIPFVIGGSNDQSYPNVAALLGSTNGCSGVINIDAHLDVRPLKEGKVHSGSPFRLLLEDTRFANGTFVEFAAQGSQSSVAHAEFVERFPGGSIKWLSNLRKSSSTVEQFEDCVDSLGSSAFISFDIDSISGADCPGVSCPATIGLTAAEALDMCRIAGRKSNVKLFDCSEYNPAAEEYRTGRLVANMFYNFLLGITERTL